MTDLSRKSLENRSIVACRRARWVHGFLLAAMAASLSLTMAESAFAQSPSSEDSSQYVPYSAFFTSFGGSFDSINFGEQDVLAFGTSVLSENGTPVASGAAGPPASTPDGTPIQMDTQVTFAPSLQLGCFEHFGESDWLWGFKCTYDHLQAASTSPRPIFPQVGTFTEGADPPVPFTGNAVAMSAQTEISHQIGFRPFIGESFDRGLVYFGGGPTLSRERTDVSQLVGFADINGNRGDMSGAPQDFSDSAWVWGGSAEVGAMFFLSRSWFVDCSYVIGVTGSRTFDFSSTFSSDYVDSNGDPMTQAGTLVGSSSWNAVTQGIGIRIGRVF